MADVADTSQQASAVGPPITFIPWDASQAFVIPGSAQTLDGFREWALSDDCPERGRFTFAGGELIIDMSRESIEEHNFIKTEITSVLHTRAKQGRLGRIYSDGCLFSNAQAGISTEPDATFATHGTLRSGRCKVVRSERPGVREEIVGSPDWVLEIISRSSMRKDKKLLHEAYFQAGVREYGLVDALGDVIEFLVCVPGEDGYQRLEPTNDWTASPIFGCSFQLTREKAADGLWEYTLHVKETP